MLLGHYLEMRAVKGAQGALRELSKLLPDTAEVIRDGKQEMIPLDQLRVNDMVFVRPGGRVPADGLVEKGESHVDESMMTGESKPVAKKTGDQVVAGTINGDGSLTIRVTKIGKDTFLSGVMRLVAQAQASKSRVQLLADRAAFYLTIIAVIVGVVTLVAWVVVAKDWTMAIERLVAVLVIACPHALGLAVPLIASISTTKAARSGFLVRERRVLEAARTVDIVVFDKTGTLTTGTYGVTTLQPIGNITPNEVLALAASVDSHSEHFIAKAIVNEAKKRNVALQSVVDFKRIAGKGVSGKVQDKTVMVGGEAILAEAGTSLAKEYIQAAKTAAAGGKTLVYVIANGSVVGYIALTDIIREESKEAIATLKSFGVSTVMITGDSEEVAQWVSSELGLDRTFARVLPDQKAAKIKELQAEGKKVAMVGDGINDAPALTQADVGIAIGAGTNVAIESAGIILVKNDPRDIVRIIKLSRRTYTKMIQNLWWAAGYNIVAMPLAAGVLAGYGIILQPAVAALLMSVSTVIVAANAMLLRKEVI
jgi:Cu2+-exporting ATPase